MSWSVIKKFVHLLPCRVPWAHIALFGILHCPSDVRRITQPDHGDFLPLHSSIVAEISPSTDTGHSQTCHVPSMSSNLFTTPSESVLEHDLQVDRAEDFWSIQLVMNPNISLTKLGSSQGTPKTVQPTHYDVSPTNPTTLLNMNTQTEPELT